MTKRALTLGFVLATAAAALAAATLPTKSLVASESHSRLAAPFSPKATIYRPDCWTMEDPFNLCDAVGGRIKE
jgi:hypothetical protein